MKLLYILIAFLFSVISGLANPISYEQGYRSYFSFDVKIAEETTTTISQNLKGGVTAVLFTCKSESDLVDYRIFVLGSKVTAAKGGYSTIYRAVSKAELDDIARFGLRNKAGAYETGKLFAPTMREATQFGKNNFMFDGLSNTVMKVRVPNSVLNNAYKFGADGMNAISIPANQLSRLRATPLNFSPLLR